VTTSARSTTRGPTGDGEPASPVAGPVRPTQQSRAATHPLPLSAVRITGGFWAARQRTNREVSIPIGSRRLRDAGNLANLELAARSSDAEGMPDDEEYRGPVFMDSDVSKWLEAVCWESAREPSSSLSSEVETFSRALAGAQRPDGYLNSYVQVVRGDHDRYRDLAMGHEHYCFGHLIQAAVAAHRAFGDCALWQVGLSAADHLARTFGPDLNPGLDGHPVVEMALVELYRETGETRFLGLAEHFITSRGRSSIRGYGREPIYFSDRVPVAESSAPEGHAVRAMYLAAGASDVASEKTDTADDLDGALERSWASMVGTLQYVTGGLGSRWDGESFGDPFELPPDVAYAETCASIGALQWAWRRLLTTGRAAYADSIERILFNGFISGVSLSGEEFFYVNTLQLRQGAVPQDHRHPVNGRRPWFRVACCPPNIMRTISQLAAYLATGDEKGLTLQQYAAGSFEHAGNRVTVDTDYPWDGGVAVTVDEVATGGDDTWTLSFRVPAWCTDAVLTDPDGATTRPAPGYASITRTWRAGDRVLLDLPMPVRLSAAHPRVDAVHGARVVERGPLVYAVEQCDLDDGLLVDDLRLLTDESAGFATEHRPDLLGGCVVVTSEVGSVSGARGTLVAVPYCLWANREPGPMRVWLPLADSTVS
jgi:uncharacterized protein